MLDARNQTAGKRKKKSDQAHKQAPRAREQWAKGSRHGRLEEEEEASWSGQVSSVIITTAKAPQMWETKQRCERKHGKY